MLYAVGCPHIPRATHYFSKERINTMKIHFAYYNQYKNGIDIAFADNTLLFLSCAEAEKNLHTTPNSQRLIDKTLQLIIRLCMLHLLLIVSCRIGLMLLMRIGVLKCYHTFIRSTNLIISLFNALLFITTPKFK